MVFLKCLIVFTKKLITLIIGPTLEERTTKQFPKTVPDNIYKLKTFPQNLKDALWPLEERAPLIIAKNKKV